MKRSEAICDGIRGSVVAFLSCRMVAFSASSNVVRMGPRRVNAPACALSLERALITTAIALPRHDYSCASVSLLRSNVCRTALTAARRAAVPPRTLWFATEERRPDGTTDHTHNSVLGCPTPPPRCFVLLLRLASKSALFSLSPAPVSARMRARTQLREYAHHMRPMQP